MDESNQGKILDLERAINELDSKRSDVVLLKKERENRLSEITNKIRSSNGRLATQEYYTLCRKQKTIKDEILSIEFELKKYTTEIRNKSTLREQLKSEFKFESSKDIKKELVKLKDEYINFSADGTRVSSMRTMAAQFAERLETLIKLV